MAGGFVTGLGLSLRKREYRAASYSIAITLARVARYCPQVTDGGWENIVDELMNSLGQLNLPLGLLFNSTAAPNMATWKVHTDILCHL